MSRSKWKGPYIDPKFFKTKNKEKKQDIPQTISRNSDIMPKFLKHTFNVHNGKKYIKLKITEEMIGHKFGEFSQTRATFQFKKKTKKK